MNFSSNIPRLYIFSFLKMALFPMAIITLFWKDQIGLTLTQILVLQSFFSLGTLLMEYPSGYISDRLGYRFSLNLSAALGVVGWCLYTIADSFMGVLVAELFLGVSFAFISGSDSALLYETLRQSDQEEHYSRYDGRMTGFAQIGEAVGALFAGVLYATAPLLPFFIQIGVWVAALGVSQTLKEPPAHTHTVTTSHLREALQTCRYALGENTHLRYTIVLTTFLGLASFYPVWLIQPYMQQTGVPVTWFGPIWAGANLTVAIFSFLSHRTGYHLGLRGMTVLFAALILVGYVGLGSVHAPWGFLFYYLLTAMRGLQGPLLRHEIQNFSERSNRASILSLKSLAFRLLFVATGPVVGIMADHFGLHATFTVLAAAFAAILLPTSVLFLKNRQLPPATS